MTIKNSGQKSTTSSDSDRQKKTSRQTHRNDTQITTDISRAGYTATPVAYGWAGAVFEVTLSFG